MLAGLSPMAYTPSPMVVRAPTRAVEKSADKLRQAAPTVQTSANDVVLVNPLAIQNEERIAPDVILAAIAFNDEQVASLKPAPLQLSSRNLEIFHVA